MTALSRQMRVSVFSCLQNMMTAPTPVHARMGVFVRTVFLHTPADVRPVIREGTVKVF